MADAARGEHGLSAPHPPARTDGGAHFEETISLADSDYSGVSTVAGGILVVSIIAMILFVPISIVAFFAFVLAISGNAIGDVFTIVGSGLPFVAVLFLGISVFVVVAILLVAVVVVVWRGGLTDSDEIHTRVTDTGVEVDRQGGYLGQSAGVSIPFETVTAVEYNDPQGDLKLNLEDAMAKKFIGGRGGDWVRIDRSAGHAVYIGSDRPRVLASVVADLAPDVDRAEPFS
jgi:hypothetical protein